MAETPITEWIGTAHLSGGAALLNTTYPGTAQYVFPTTRDVVKLVFREPIESLGQLGDIALTQELDLAVTAPQDRALQAALEVLRRLVDIVSFGSGRPVEIHLPYLAAAENQLGKTLPNVSRFRLQGDPIQLDANFLGFVADKMGNPESDLCRKITRALRWLRRATLTEDHIEEFATLAYAAEAIASLLPDPPPQDSKNEQGPPSSPPSDTARRLTHWAIAEMGLTEDQWKLVGRCRNALFHGGLTESPETDAMVAQANVVLRFALVGALKRVLQLSPSDPPPVSLAPYVVVGISVAAPKFTPASRPQPGTETTTAPDEA